MQKLMSEKAEELIRIVRNAGVATVFDTGWDPGGWAPRTVKEIRRVLKFVNVFLPNMKEARRITGCLYPGKAAQKLLSYGPDVVAIKLGPRGCLVANRKEKVRAPGFKCQAFDAIGAGDAFNASFILGYLQGWDLRKIAKFANATGALIVSNKSQGADRFPTRKEVEDFLGL
jgi:sugar/nucleoside kinase (ribokinase family)